jgi:hypothetical protein
VLYVETEPTATTASSTDAVSTLAAAAAAAAAAVAAIVTLSRIMLNTNFLYFGFLTLNLTLYTELGVILMPILPSLLQW